MINSIIYQIYVFLEQTSKIQEMRRVEIEKDNFLLEISKICEEKDQYVYLEFNLTDEEDKVDRLALYYENNIHQFKLPGFKFYYNAMKNQRLRRYNTIGGACNNLIRKPIVNKIITPYEDIWKDMFEQLKLDLI